MSQLLHDYLPLWAHQWLPPIELGLQVIITILLAWLARRIVWRLVQRIGVTYHLPPGMLVPLRTLAGWIIVIAALLSIMQMFGVSATVIWSAFTGFAAVAAVAFFAAWSVLSNLFCSLLIFTSAPFRVGDRVELLDASDKPGVRGRVLEIRLIYTVLEDLTSPETKGAHLQIPNSAFFQKTLRRWRPDDQEIEAFRWHGPNGF